MRSKAVRSPASRRPARPSRRARPAGDRPGSRSPPSAPGSPRTRRRVAASAPSGSRGTSRRRARCPRRSMADRPARAPASRRSGRATAAAARSRRRPGNARSLPRTRTPRRPAAAGADRAPRSAARAPSPRSAPRRRPCGRRGSGRAAHRPGRSPWPPSTPRRLRYARPARPSLRAAVRDSSEGSRPTHRRRRWPRACPSAYRSEAATGRQRRRRPCRAGSGARSGPDARVGRIGRIVPVADVNHAQAVVGLRQRPGQEAGDRSLRGLWLSAGVPHRGPRAAGSAAA